MEQIVHTTNMFFFLFTMMSLVYGKILHIWEHHRMVEYVIGTFCFIGGMFALFSSNVIDAWVALVASEAASVILISYLFIMALSHREKDNKCPYNQDSSCIH